jgi:hypothetical protein
MTQTWVRDLLKVAIGPAPKGLGFAHPEMYAPQASFRGSGLTAMMKTGDFDRDERCFAGRFVKGSRSEKRWYERLTRELTRGMQRKTLSVTLTPEELMPHS